MKHRTTAHLALSLFALAPASQALAPQAAQATPERQPSASLPSFFWNDYDADGRLDAFVLEPGAGGRLLHNVGDGTFLDVTQTAGLHGLADEAFQGLWGDYDQDGRADLFLASYTGESRLLRQMAGGVFAPTTDSGLPALLPLVDARWVATDDARGPDLHVTTLAGERFFHNTGGSFAESDVLGRGPTSPAGRASASVEQARAQLGLPPLGSARLSIQDAPGKSGGALGPQQAIDLTCALTIEDAATGMCIGASSVPTLGMLMPLNTFFNVTPTGEVGIGTTSPTSTLEVAGTARVQGLELVTAPFDGAVLTSDSAGEATWQAPVPGPAGPQGDPGPTGPQGLQGPVGPDGPQGLQGDPGPTGPQGLQGPVGSDGPQGLQGDPGPTGPQGLQGPVGPDGPQGLQGDPGPTGPQGLQGDPGPTGPQGLQGPVGSDGPQGLQGDPGPTGPQGLQGDPGPTGPQGLQGPVGSDGPQGLQGPVGSDGPQGLQGDPGPTGPQGLQGDPGPTGPQGLQGPVGSDGPQGLQGDPGPTGPQGLQGDPGPTGPQGLQGPVGSDGPQGLQGDPGPTGPQGLQGDPGPTGPQGLQGPVGSDGPQGLQGDPGPTGPQGLQGDPGPIGPQGLQGPVGSDGPQGLQGDPGPTGPQGIPGPSGPQGFQGPVGPDGPQGLQGDPGPTGPQGVQGDPGPDGPTGPQGDPGPSPYRLFVDPLTGTPTGPVVFDAIQPAIDAGALAPPAVVVVAAGTYIENLTLADGVSLRGTSEMMTHATILDGSLSYAGTGEASLVGLFVPTGSVSSALVLHTGTGLLRLFNCSVQNTAAFPALEVTGGGLVEATDCVLRSDSGTGGTLGTGAIRVASGSFVGFRTNVIGNSAMLPSVVPEKSAVVEGSASLELYGPGTLIGQVDVTGATASAVLSNVSVDGGTQPAVRSASTSPVVLSMVGLITSASVAVDNGATSPVNYAVLGYGGSGTGFTNGPTTGLATAMVVEGADNTLYDPTRATVAPLSATTVQDALDELADRMASSTVAGPTVAELQEELAARDAKLARLGARQAELERRLDELARTLGVATGDLVSAAPANR